MKAASKWRREMADRIERRPNAEKAENRTADQSTHQSDPDDYKGHLDVHSSLDVALHEVPTANDRWVSNFDQFFVRLPITVKCSPHRFHRQSPRLAVDVVRSVPVFPSRHARQRR